MGILGAYCRVFPQDRSSIRYVVAANDTVIRPVTCVWRDHSAADSPPSEDSPLRSRLASHGDTVEAELAAVGTGAPLDPATGPGQPTVTGDSTVIDNGTVTIDNNSVTDPTTADGSDRDE